MIVLRALGALLSYPGQDLRDSLPEIAAQVTASPLVGSEDRAALLGLIELLRDADPLWTEERYVEVFDRGRATSLHLFEHVHGEARDRGQAMVELKSLYERAGLAFTANELPDYLPAVLEYLSCRDLAEAKAMLGDCSHILRAIGEALLERQSCYAAVFQALLSIADKDGLNPKASRPKIDVTEDLDQTWEERPPFAGPASAS